MAFPNVVFGLEGEQFNVYSTNPPNGFSLGTQMIFQDGRKFRLAKAGTSTLVVGNLIAAIANVANDNTRAGIATAIGATVPTLTLGGATTANLYAEGYFVVDGTPGMNVYKIKSHPAGTTAVPFTLWPGVSIQTAITTGSKVSLIKHPYDAVIQAPVTTLVAPILGVAVTAPTTTQYCWLQTRGIASVLTSGTVVIGNPAFAAGGAAGACGPASSGGSETQMPIGWVQGVGTTTAEVFLTIDG